MEKKSTVTANSSFILLVGLLLFDWLAAPAPGSLDGKGVGTHLSPQYARRILLGAPCHAAHPCSASAAGSHRVARVRAAPGLRDGWAGSKHRQGKCRQEDRRHRGLVGPALWVALPAPSYSSALGLPTRMRGPHPRGSFSNP